MTTKTMQRTLNETTTDPVDELVQEWKAALAGRGHSERGIDRYSCQLSHFIACSAITDLTRITPIMIHRYQAYLGRSKYSTSTIQIALTALRSFSQWLIEMEYRDDDPTAKCHWPKRPERILPPLHHDQIQFLWATIEVPQDGITPLQRWIWQRNRRIVLIMLLAGLRISEVTALRWSDIDLDGKTLYVREGKGGKGRIVPLHEKLVEEFRLVKDRDQDHAVVGLPNGEGFKSYKSLAHVFERWLVSKGVKTHAHQLRRTFGTTLRRNGVDLETIRQLLGHADLETTKLYLGVNEDDLRIGVNRLPSDW